jgi:hypothetical protein
MFFLSAGKYLPKFRRSIVASFSAIQSKNREESKLLFKRRNLKCNKYYSHSYNETED